jgi:ABC-type polysaccharide/polyol phosphate transport system ATPase subunit
MSAKSPSIQARAIRVDYPVVLTGRQQSLFASFAGAVIPAKLRKREGATRFVTALRGIDLKIGAGDRIGIIGRNGAGKSSLLKLLAGILPPSAGRLSIQGTTSSILQIGSGMDMDMSGYENIQRMSRLLSIPKDQWDDVRANVEEFTELGSFLALPVRSYSAGMSVRLGFAMATAYPRDILVVDEVIGAGDQFFMQKAAKRLETYTQQAKILILATHEKSALDKFCNQAIHLDSGRIAFQGSVDEAWASYCESPSAAAA